MNEMERRPLVTGRLHSFRWYKLRIWDDYGPELLRINIGPMRRCCGYTSKDREVLLARKTPSLPDTWTWVAISESAAVFPEIKTSGLEARGLVQLERRKPCPEPYLKWSTKRESG